jgi:CRP-like cAMP-binding protein
MSPPNCHFIVAGGFRVTEIGLTLPGQFVGELGLLAPSGRRTQSLERVADGELLTISYEHVTELYFQNPDFGFHFLQLTTSRLFQNLDVMQAELEALRRQVSQESLMTFGGTAKKSDRRSNRKSWRWMPSLLSEGRASPEPDDVRRNRPKACRNQAIKELEMDAFAYQEGIRSARS